jgi:hypothetical protein
MSDPSIYTAPDIRRQTIDEIDAHITAKRARRLTLLYSFKEKQSMKAEKLSAVELARFAKRVEKARAALDKINDAIAAADRAIVALEQTNHNLNNLARDIFKDEETIPH